jgi:radical SAM protein with 4Fe4S-binding SPASM domain
MAAAPAPMQHPFVPIPKYLQIEPVGQCNLRCRMCPIQFRQDGPPWGPPALMPFDRFTELVDGFPELEELHIQGLGEPLMHPRFFDMVRYAVGRGIRVSTNSNLTLLTAPRARECVASGLEWLHVSVDGATAETYEYIRVWSNFARVLRNLRHLLKARRDAENELPRVRLITVIMRRNLDELPRLVNLACDLGVDAMFVQHLCHDFGESTLPAHYKPMREFIDEQTLLGEDHELVQTIFARAREVAAERGLDLRLPSLTPKVHPPGTPGPQRCDWPWRGSYVSYDGSAMPCCMIATPDRANFGNVFTEGVPAVWHGTDAQDFRARLASDEPPEVCQSCALYRGTF